GRGGRDPALPGDARPGAGLQGRHAEDPGAARAGEIETRRRLRPGGVPRPGADRRRPAAGAAGGARGRLDRGAGRAVSEGVTVRRLAGAGIGPWLEEVAGLRVAVFRDWPYLYEGDPAYEREYLKAYADSADSVVVLAFDGDKVVGASTGLPLADDSAEFQKPFLDA